MIRFLKYYAKSTENMFVAKVRYSLDNRIDGRKCVTIYEDGYTARLSRVMGDQVEVIDNTDIMTDYFEKGKVVLFEDHPLYAEARKAAERSVK